MIGSLLYLAASSSNLCYSMGVCVRYQANPKDSHLLVVKKIIKYFSEIENYSLWYTRDTIASLVRYCDVDWARNSKDRKSTSERCFFLGNNLMSWFSRKKNRISLSTIEVEYIATSSGCTKLIWMKNMFKDYDVSREVLTLYCDNLSAINILNNPIQHSRLKHIDI